MQLPDRILAKAAYLTKQRNAKHVIVESNGKCFIELADLWTGRRSAVTELKGSKVKIIDNEGKEIKTMDYSEPKKTVKKSKTTKSVKEPEKEAEKPEDSNDV